MPALLNYSYGNRFEQVFLTLDKVGFVLVMENLASHGI